MLKACASPLTLRSSAVCVKGTAAAAVGAAASATLALIAARITLYLTFVCACLINDDASVALLLRHHHCRLPLSSVVFSALGPFSSSCFSSCYFALAAATPIVAAAVASLLC